MVSIVQPIQVPKLFAIVRYANFDVLTAASLGWFSLLSVLSLATIFP